ncbi:MAG: zonular occludens toxin domain-containing protein [Candidatus Micrarchaeia archaeon]|jgi:DNA helicase HerA-like ATPase
MGKKRKGVLDYIAGFFRFIINIIFGFFKLIYSTAELIVKKLEHRSEKVEEEKEKTKSGFEHLIEMENVGGSLEGFEKNLYSKKSTIGLILGARGSGKSAVGMRILENFAAKTKKKLYAIGFERETLPKWIKIPENIKKIEGDSFVLIDEAGIEFSSRDSMKNANKLLSQIILISRHKNLSILFISQNSSNIEINTIRQSDYLILKKPSLLQLDFERKKIKEIYLGVDEKFKKYENMPGVNYIYSDWYLGFATNNLPSFWSEGLSKSYRKK